MKYSPIIIFLLTAIPFPAKPQAAADSIDSLLDSIPGMSTVELDAVTVTAEMKKRDAVTETITVTNAMRKGTNNAIDMLGNIPGIRLDRLTETIKVGIESNVPILVDGKEVDVDYAKSINPNRIYKIEIMRHPTGRYAEYPAVVNMILKSSFEGWDLGVKARGMVSLRNRHSNSEDAGASFAYSTRKWNLYTDIDYKRSLIYESTAYEQDIAGTYREVTSPAEESSPNGRDRKNACKAFAGWDYKFNENHRLTLQGQAMMSKANDRESYHVLTPESRQTTTDSYRTKEFAGGLFYNGRLGEKFRIKAETFYDFYQNRDHYSFFQTIPDTESLSPTLGKKYFLRSYVSGTYSLSNGLHFILSDMFTYRKYDLDNLLDPTDSYSSDEYRNRIDINALWSPKSNFSLNGGITALSVSNNYLSKGTKLEKTTWSPLPYARIYWRFHPLWSMNLNYYYNLTYPSLDLLAPIRYNTGSHTYREGNPALRAEAMHYAELELSFKGMLKLTYLERFDNHNITDYYRIDGNGDVVRTPVNSSHRYSLISLSGDFNITDSFHWNVEMSYRRYRRSSDMTAKRRGHSWYLETQASYLFNGAGLMATASYFLRYDKLPLLQGREYGQEEKLAVGLNKALLKNRVTLSLMGTIPVSAISKLRWQKIDIPGHRSATYVNDKVNQAILMASLKMALGNNKSTTRKNSLELEKEK